MGDFCRQDCEGIGYIMSMSLLVAIVLPLLIAISSTEVWATMYSQEDRYRVITDSDNLGTSTGGSNPGGTTNYGYSDGTSNGGNSANANNYNYGNRPKTNGKVKTVAIKAYDEGDDFDCFNKEKVKSVSKRVNTGTVRIKFKKTKKYVAGGGYLKFTATNKRKYSFIITDVKRADGKGALGYCYILGQDSNNAEELTWLDVSTKGGRTKTLWYANYKTTMYDGTWYDGSGNHNIQLSDTTIGRIDLQAGQTVYLCFSYVIDRYDFILTIR